MNKKMNRIAEVERVMEIEAYPVVVPDEPDDGQRHQHVAIAWRGGVIWLDMSDQSDHFCVDVRQFVASDVEGVELAGQGVFTIVNGRRQALAAESPGRTGAQIKPTCWDALEDPDGTPVRGHGWNAGYVVTLMHDKERSEKQTNRPAAPGRG
jgi:hypothetical protein